MRKQRNWRAGRIVGIILGLLLLCITSQVLYTIASLNWAIGEGVYETPQQGVMSRVQRWYCGVEKVEIEHAGTNSFDGSDPHVWYVIWRVYADNRAPCDPDRPGAALAHGASSEGGGNFYLNIPSGWVYMPEGRFPMLLGFWMKVLGLAGPGDSTHIPRD